MFNKPVPTVKHTADIIAPFLATLLNNSLMIKNMPKSTRFLKRITAIQLPPNCCTTNIFKNSKGNYTQES